MAITDAKLVFILTIVLLFSAFMANVIEIAYIEVENGFVGAPPEGLEGFRGMTRSLWNMMTLRIEGLPHMPNLLLNIFLYYPTTAALTWKILNIVKDVIPFT